MPPGLPLHMGFTNINPAVSQSYRLTPVTAAPWLLLSENRVSAPRDRQTDQYEIKKIVSPYFTNVYSIRRRPVSTNPYTPAKTQIPIGPR
jgi:hypothetical protein